MTCYSFLYFCAFALCSAQARANEKDCVKYIDEKYNFETQSDLRSQETRAPIRNFLRSQILTQDIAFCEKYILARTYILDGDFSEAISLIDSMRLETSPPELCCNSPYNLKGFALLRAGAFEPAAEAFLEQTEVPRFASFNASEKMKVFNNLGYTYIELGRFDDALKFLKKAAILGSEKAKYNIERVSSIIETLRANSGDGSGAFATVIFFTKDANSLSKERSRLASLFSVDEADIGVFVNSTGRFFFTLNKYQSYPDAENSMLEARELGVDDAWIALIDDWKDLGSSL